VVLAVEEALTSAATIAANPAIVEDVKVMGVRRGDAIALTIACAFVDRHLRGRSDYAAAKILVAALGEAAARHGLTDRGKRTGPLDCVLFPQIRIFPQRWRACPELVEGTLP
jgi:S-adenosylmethionine synthetase